MVNVLPFSWLLSRQKIAPLWASKHSFDVDKPKRGDPFYIGIFQWVPDRISKSLRWGGEIFFPPLGLFPPIPYHDPYILMKKLIQNSAVAWIVNFLAGRASIYLRYPKQFVENMCEVEKRSPLISGLSIWLIKLNLPTSFRIRVAKWSICSIPYFRKI